MGIGENTYKVLNIADYVEKPFAVSKMLWRMSRYQSFANGGQMRTSVAGLFPNHGEECTENIYRQTLCGPRCVGSCVMVSVLFMQWYMAANFQTIRIWLIQPWSMTSELQTTFAFPTSSMTIPLDSRNGISFLTVVGIFIPSAAIMICILIQS